MKYILLCIFYFLSLPLIVQAQQDSVRSHFGYEYLIMAVEQDGFICSVFISTDSTSYTKSFEDVKCFRLTEALKMLSAFNDDGWEIQSSNAAIIKEPYLRTYFYYLLYRKRQR